MVLWLIRTNEIEEKITIFFLMHFSEYFANRDIFKEASKKILNNYEAFFCLQLETIKHVNMHIILLNSQLETVPKSRLFPEVKTPFSKKK